ncbi:MAG: N-acetyltransferase [Deltaproteobacteria bacterium]|nr:N-acetyltransferase [Candidatus Anaeroferrophillacea bacterium]
MIRTAITQDVPPIQRLLEHYAKQGLLLSRSLSDLYDNLRDFTVFESDGMLAGAAGLHVCWADLGEIRSLAVAPDHARQGIGSRLVEHCEAAARELGLRQVFTLTYQTAFFQRLGYQITDKSSLPHKVWADCLKCPKFPDCDEIAMIKGLA